MERNEECPKCGGEQKFWLTASMEVHLGEKTKWRCSECNFGFIEINGVSTLA